MDENPYRSPNANPDPQRGNQLLRAIAIAIFALLGILSAGIGCLVTCAAVEIKTKGNGGIVSIGLGILVAIIVSGITYAGLDRIKKGPR